ncbi:hypothetical protein ACFWY6_09960 [Streptomyces sp. NPDC059037]|uniref:hypothetical protein n=1 Tax=Streptomyces sp. NPDC059037 TaxID=3346710 RepID=UPI0036A102E2
MRSATASAGRGPDAALRALHGHGRPEAAPPLDPRRWKILAVIGLTQLMVVLAGGRPARALGGAAATFEVLVTARALQGVFAALAASGGAVGLLLGGLLTEHLSRRSTLYVNVLFAAVAVTGGAPLHWPRPGASARCSASRKPAATAGRPRTAAASSRPPPC